MRSFRKIGKWVLLLIAAVVIFAVTMIGYLSITEYSPGEIETLAVTMNPRPYTMPMGKRMVAVSWNIGYGGLGRNQNFFMDGGDMVRPDRKQDVEENLAGIVSGLSQQKADLYLIQEADVNSKRSYYIDQRAAMERGLMMGSSYARNYQCDYVPFPWPPIGKVDSGLMNFSLYQVDEATRESLPVPFSWPIRLANLKRCLLVERMPVENSDKELVVINLHLEAYEDGAGRKKQTEMLMQILQAERRNGNYVVVGGDFNQTFPGATEYPILNEALWKPGALEGNELPEGFRYVFDSATPTCRLLNRNYSGNRKETQLFVIDGFILSDNVKVNHIQTIDLNFQHSDHNPVRLEFTLLDE